MNVQQMEVGRLMFNSTDEIYTVRRYEQSIFGWHPSLGLLLGRLSLPEPLSSWYVISRKGNLWLTHFVIITQKRFDYWSFVNSTTREKRLGKGNDPCAPCFPIFNPITWHMLHKILMNMSKPDAVFLSGTKRYHACSEKVYLAKNDSHPHART